MKKIYYLLGLLVISLFVAPSVSAASLSITASTRSVTVGGSVIITVKSDGVGGAYSITSSNGAVLSGGTNSTWIESGTRETYTFKANGVGSATVTLTTIDAADQANETPYTTSKSITVNVNAKAVVVLSSDNTLSGFGIDGVGLNPEFNKDTLEYSTELEPETTSVNISAIKSHPGATISGDGTREVSDGENRLEVVVTAENGSSRTYVINANVKEYNPITVSLDNKEYTVIRKSSSIPKVEGYTETKIKINEEEIPALKSDVTKYVLVALKDSDGNIQLYVYDNGKYTLYKEYKFNRIVLYPLEFTKAPDGYSKTTITYNDEKITAYKLNSKSNYALIYGMNVETGEKRIYMYDKAEDTLQIYNTEELEQLHEDLDLMKKIVAILAGVSVFLLIIVIVVSVKKRTKKDKNNDKTIDLTENKLSRSEKKALNKKTKKSKKNINDEILEAIENKGY